MRRPALLLAAACAATLAAHVPASAQLAIAAKAGTTGVGGEVSFGLGSRLALRGSATIYPIKPKFTISDVEYEAEPPAAIFTGGVDLFLTPGLRVFGGVMSGVDNLLTLNGDYNQSVQFGDRTYTGSGTITANVSSKKLAPYAGIGFGRTIGSGIGLTFDVGGAMLGESTVTLSSTGPINSAPDYEANRQREQDNIQEYVDKYAKIFPMLSIALRIGLGG